MVEKRNWSHIANYVTGISSDDEKRAFEAQLMSDQGLRDAVDEARRIWEGAGLESEPELARWDLSATWEAFVRKKKITSSREAGRVFMLQRHASPAALSHGRRPRATVGAWAAAAAITAVAGAALWFRAEVNTRDTAAISAAAPMYTVATKPGQRLDLRMPDGSRVVLGVASTLRYAKGYGKSRRDVYLEGRAYFEVTHDETRPFVVHAGNAVARDLGTRFDVRAYGGDGRVDVVVAEGEVELASNGEDTLKTKRSVRLAAGHLGRVNAAGNVTSRTSVDVDQYTSWTEGRLEFEDAALRDVLPELSRWYGVEFRVADHALGARRFTGTFSDESLPELLQIFSFSVGAGYERDGDTITLVLNRQAQ